MKLFSQIRGDSKTLWMAAAGGGIIATSAVNDVGYSLARFAPGGSDFLTLESASRLVPLRQAVDKYPRVLCYKTAWRMTWILLDENRVVRDYYLTAQ